MLMHRRWCSLVCMKIVHGVTKINSRNGAPSVGVAGGELFLSLLVCKKCVSHKLYLALVTDGH